jgi:hypothetical protein
MTALNNHEIAQKLLEYAQFLEAREVNPYRVRAYRRAAETVLALDQPLVDLVATAGRPGLEELPGIGSRLSYALEELARTGEFRALSAEGGQNHPEEILESLPGIGPHLARHIHEQLGIRTLEEIEQAAHDGRLSQVGVGPKRLRGIRDALAGRLGRYRFARPLQNEPRVAELLKVDQEYRDRVDSCQLPMIAPRRFNPNQKSWLPIYQTRRGGWRYRALFSNTALAHRLGQTHDWVVIYFEAGALTGQRTIVTETRGELSGRRVVRGREQECWEYYNPIATDEHRSTQIEKEIKAGETAIAG